MKKVGLGLWILSLSFFFWFASRALALAYGRVFVHYMTALKWVCLFLGAIFILWPIIKAIIWLIKKEEE